MNVVSVTLGTLVDKALYELQGPQEQGRRVVMGSTALTDSSTTFTLTDPDAQIAITDLIEFGSEIVLVTDKSSDVVPVYTCARGYYGSTPAAQPAGTVGLVNPSFPRVRVAEAVKRSFARLEALGLPLVTSDTFERVTDLMYCELPADTREVLRVSYYEPQTGRYHEIPNWRFFDDIPTDRVSTGKMLRLGRNVRNDDELDVVYRIPYRWSTWPAAPTEASTISITEGAEDLPAMYAAAWLTISREVSRADIDRVPEWQSGEPVRGGVSLSLVKLKWQDFYRSLDEARRLYVAPIHRPYIQMPRFR